MPKSVLTAVILLSGMPAVVCAAAPEFQWDGFFARKISEYRLFEDSVRQRPRAGLVPFDIITPLFSDYAHKSRFVLLPQGQSAVYSEDDVFEFPVGTLLVKSFWYPHDFRQSDQARRLIETRLLVHTEDRGWFGAAYLWNDEQSDADLAVAGARVPVEWIDGEGHPQTLQYTVPNMNQCRFCHSSHGQGKPLGLSARQLNRDVETEDGTTVNQLLAWQHSGMLRGAPDPESAPRAARWDDPASASVFDRVRSYFDTNCSHCHSPGGLASSKGVDMRYSQTEPWKRGVDLRSTGGSHAESRLEKVIVSGHPQRSSVYLRMTSTDFTFMMPQIGRTLVHEEGAALIAEWIRSLQSD